MLIFNFILEMMEDQAVIFKNDILRGVSLAVKNVIIWLYIQFCNFFLNLCHRSQVGILCSKYV